MFMVTVTIAAIGMVMIMLRSAMHPYKSVKRNPYLDQDEKMSEHEEYKSYVGYMSEFVNMYKTKDDGDDSSEPTATWSGSMDSKSEEEKPLSPTTPAISWENHVSSPGSNNGEEDHNKGARPSSLMFSPPNRDPERNFFHLSSPLSSNTNNLSPSSQTMSDAHVDEEEQPLSPETSSIVWDNDWEQKVNKQLTGSSPLGPGSTAGRMMLSSPVPDEVNDEEQLLSPETPVISWDDMKLERKASAATPSSAVSNDSIPSLHSDSSKPDDVADSLRAMGFIGALFGSPAPKIWHDDGENLDAVPSISWDEKSLSPVSSRVNSPDAMNAGVASYANNDEETPLSPESSLARASFSSQVGTFRPRFTPQLKAQPISKYHDELEQMTPQARDDEEAVSDENERSTSKGFNVLRFGSPDFLFPFRGAATDYKKID